MEKKSRLLLVITILNNSLMCVYGTFGVPSASNPLTNNPMQTITDGSIEDPIDPMGKWSELNHCFHRIRHLLS